MQRKFSKEEQGNMRHNAPRSPVKRRFSIMRPGALCQPGPVEEWLRGGRNVGPALAELYHHLLS